MTGPTDSLYAGPDLHRAAGQSLISVTLRDRLKGVHNACVIAGDMIANRLRRSEVGLEVAVARGASSVSGETIFAAYGGTGRNRDWCLSMVFADGEITARRGVETAGQVARALRDAAADGANVVFTDGVAEARLPPGGWGSPAGAGSYGGGRTFVMPAWVKQRLRVSGDWSRQLAALRRDTRQEISRVLRKYRYGCRLTRRVEDHAHFYDDLYRPYVARRFGNAAHVVDRTQFLTECRRGVLLHLVQDDAVVGAALLRPLGRTLAVVWSALDPERDPARLRGATDAMDYFSLLYAHLTSCRWLDLGPSRPDLFDGALRYKAKWGCELHAGLVPQAEIRVTCPDRDVAGGEFLGRHAFIVKARRGFRGLFFVDGATDPETLRTKLSAALTRGIVDYRVVALTPLDDPLKGAVNSIAADVALVEENQPLTGR